MKRSLVFFLVVAFAASAITQVNIFQEEQDWRFAKQLAEKGMHDLAALQFAKYAENYSSSPNAPEALLHSAQNYEKTGQPNVASETYLKLILKYPQSVLIDQAQFNRALILTKLKEYLSAGLSFERVRLLAPKSELAPQAQLSAGEAFLRANELPRAIGALQLLLEEYPTHPLRLQARYLLAQIRNRQKQPSIALQELDRIAGDRLEDDLTVKAQLLRSELLQQIGRYSQADSVLRTIVGSGMKSDSVGAAAVKLAETLQWRGDYQGSQAVIEQAISLPASQAFQSRLRLVQGDNYYALKDYQAAAQSYAAIPSEQLPVNDLIALEFRKGAVQQKLGKNMIALGHFQEVLSSPDTLASARLLQRPAAFAAADILTSEEKPVEALRLLRNEMERAKNQGWADELLFRIGKTQDEFLQDRVGARRTFAVLLELYPQSRFADDAQLGIARSFDGEGQYWQALDEYQRYCQLFPSSDDYEAIRQRMDMLQKFAYAPSDVADKAFNEVLSQSLSGVETAQLLAKWAEQQIMVFHDYHRGLALIRQAMDAAGSERIDAAKVLYLIGYSHALLMEKYAWEHQPIKANAHRDTLWSSAALMVEKYPASEWSSRLKSLVIDVELKTLATAQERAILLDSTLAYFAKQNAPDSLLREYKHRLAQELYLANQDSVNVTALQRAARLCKEAGDSLAPNDLVARNQLLHAMIFLRLSRPDTAAIMLEDFLNTFPNAPQVVQASFQLAGIYAKSGQTEKAKEIYQDIAERYHYTQLASQARKRYCQILLDEGKTDAAISCLQEKLDLQALRNLAFFFSYAVDDDFLWLWTQAIQAKSQPMEARAALKDYLALSQQGKHRAEALLSLGELAYQSRDIDAALGHWEELAQTFPQDSLAALARVRSADIYFDRSKYVEAGRLYTSLRTALHGDLLRHASAREALCELKAGNLAKADRLMDAFKKQFSDRRSEATFLYEKGNYLIDQKNFKEAEAVFKDLTGKYKDIPEGAKGELGLGRLYVILNRTEDALKILTNIPNKYKDPDIIAAAYVNLGDFYYENRQLENCIFACRQAIQAQKHGPEHAEAVRILIRAYDDFRLWDQAIALTREYVDSYPDAPDLTVKRSQIGVFLYNLKDYDRAISYLRELKPLVDADTETELQYWIAKCYADRGDTEEAITEFLKVKYLCKETKLPWGATALYEAAQSYRKLGELKKAKDLYQEIVRDRGAVDQIGRVAGERIKEIEEELAKSS